MVIYEATSSNFKKYGRIVKNIDFAPVIEALNNIALPAEGVAYEPTVASLEEEPFKDEPFEEEFKVDILKVTAEAENRVEIAPTLETAYEDIASSSVSINMPIIPDSPEAPIANTERDEYQLSFDESTLPIPSMMSHEMSFEKAVEKKPRFVIEDEDEAMPIKKGRISFGDDDDDEEEDDEEGFFFKKKKK